MSSDTATPEATTGTGAQEPPAARRPPGPADRGDRDVPSDSEARRGGRSRKDSSGEAPKTEAPTGRKARRRRLRARRVDRILRRIDPWSVLKVSFFFLLSLWVVVLLAGAILWSAATGSGAIDNVEEFVTELFGLKTFAFEGEQLFRGIAVGGLIMVLAGTAFSVLLSVLFNLISDLTGGIQLSVVELENVRDPAKAPPTRGGRRRRAGGRRASSDP